MNYDDISVSVIVPVYKVEEYLERCVDSLLNQTYSNLEIILVDDGSPDNCPEICDKYASNYSNVISLHKLNGGLSSARNYGVINANNDWMVFVDSDDYVEADYVETLVSLKIKYDADLVITRIVRELDSQKKVQRKTLFEPYIATKDDTIFKVYSGIDVGWSAYGKLIPKELMLRFPFPDGYYEDCACMYKIIYECNNIVIGDFSNNYHYIQREGSILSTKLNPKHFRIFEIAEEFIGFLTSSYNKPETLIILFYKRIIVQLLNMQKMSWKEYKKIFYMYNNDFRKNLKRVCDDSRVTIEVKIYLLFLSGNYFCYFLFFNCIKTIKKLQNKF